MAQLHYGDLEARRQLADVDPDQQAQAGINAQGEGYGVFSDDQKSSANSPPPISSEAPLQAHHERKDPINTDVKTPLVVPPGVGNFPVTGGYGNLDLTQDESGKALPAAPGVDEGGRRVLRHAPKEESMAKELEDRPSAGRGGMIDVHALKDGFVDLSGGNIDEIDVDNQPSNEVASHAVTGKFTSQMEPSDDDPKPEQFSQNASPVDDQKREKNSEMAEDSNQPGSKPCPPSDDHSQGGGHSFEGEDGREKINVESFNVYSGEPEKVVYDAADVMNGQPESGPIGVDDLGDAKQETEPPLNQNDNVRRLGEGGMQPGAEKDEDIAQELERKLDVHDFREDEVQSQKEKGADVDARDVPEGEMQSQTDLPEGDMQLQSDERADTDVQKRSQVGADINMGNLREVEMQARPEEDANIAQELDKKLDAWELREDQVPSQTDKGQSQTEKQADLPVEHDDKATIADIPLEQQTDFPLEQEDKATIADVKSNEQTGMRQVRNPKGADEDVQEEFLSKDKKETLQQESGDVIKEAEGKERDTFEREQKAMVEGDEQFAMNAAVEDDNARNLPVEQDTDLKDSTEIAGAFDQEQKAMAPQGDEQLAMRVSVENYNARDLPVEQDEDLKIGTENAGVESPYTDYNRTDDYVKAGYGAEGFLPKNNEEVERQLKEPVGREEERRQTDEHPLDKLLELDEQGKYDEQVQLPPSIQPNEVYDRPSTLPHPQPEDLTRVVNNGGSRKDDTFDNNTKYPGCEDPHEGTPHKKGVFERIKDKLTPPYNDHSH